jgi:ATP-binding cassette subfamily C (CFTR/MRP) protein 1
MLTYNADLWVQWWSEASYGPGSRSLNYWIEVYAVLGLLPILSLGAWIT